MRPTPTIGRIVRYTLSADDVLRIQKRRVDFIKHVKSPEYKDTGYVAHFGMAVTEGDVFPMIITNVTETGLINGTVFLDGDTLWVGHVSEGIGPDEWHWPDLG